MSFLDHLEELRWTLVKSLVVFLIGFILVASFLERVSNWLRWPLDYGIRDNPDVLRLITTTPLAIFTVFMMVCFLGAIAMSLPFILYFVGQFVAPALTKKERGLLIPGLLLGTVLFVMGSLFAFFLLVPSVIKVSVYMNALLGFEVLWSADRYYSMLAWMVVGMGLAFQLPLAMQVPVYLDIITVEKYRSWRRIMILICTIAAAIITPTPDPFNMFLVALPLILLYELGVWLARVYTSKRVSQGRI